MMRSQHAFSPLFSFPANPVIPRHVPMVLRSPELYLNTIAIVRHDSDTGNRRATSVGPLRQHAFSEFRESCSLCPGWLGSPSSWTQGGPDKICVPAPTIHPQRGPCPGRDGSLCRRRREHHEPLVVQSGLTRPRAGPCLVRIRTMWVAKENKRGGRERTGNQPLQRPACR